MVASWVSVPLRVSALPVLKFLYMYFLGLGFLDGRAGLTYCVLQAWYQYQIGLKVRELQRAARGLTPG